MNPYDFTPENLRLVIYLVGLLCFTCLLSSVILSAMSPKEPSQLYANVVGHLLEMTKLSLVGLLGLITGQLSHL